MSFNILAVWCQALRSQYYTVPPAPKCLKWGMFLPNDWSYQDVWLKPHLLSLAYVQVLQYWAEEPNPLAPSEPHPLAMSVRELRWCIGKYTTFSKHDDFEGLGNAVPEAKYGDMGTPPADSTASSATTDVEDTQLSPTETQLADDTISPLPWYKSEAKDKDMGTSLADSTTSPAKMDAKDTQSSPVETPLVDDTTVLVAKPNTEIQKNLPAVQGASPAKLEDLVGPVVVLVDKLASPLTLASHMVKERQEYLQWIQAHSSQKVATVGSVPYKSGEPQQCHKCSLKWHKRVWCLLEEEWQDLGDVSGSASSKDSPELAPWDKKGKGANLMECPPEFWEIPECLTVRGTLEGGPCLHGCSWGQCGPKPLMESMITMVVSPSMGEGSMNRCCLCVGCDHLNGDHEFWGPLNGGCPPVGHSGGTGRRRLGRGLPLTV